MTTMQTIILAICCVLLITIVAAVFVASLFGIDIKCFESWKTTAPKQYRNLKRVCRLNGPITAIGSGIGLIAVPSVAFDPDGGVLIALAMLVVFAMFMWLSIRWFFWSLNP